MFSNVVCYSRRKNEYLWSKGIMYAILFLIYSGLLLLFYFRGFRIGFNSLCAFASVNHAHLHAYYLDRELFVESVVRTIYILYTCIIIKLLSFLYGYFSKCFYLTNMIVACCQLKMCFCTFYWY